MPASEVMSKFKSGKLHSGSKSGPEVTNPHQAIAIMLSEKRAEDAGKEEYQPKKKASSASGGGFASIRKPAQEE